MVRILVPQDYGKCVDLAGSTSKVTFTVPASMNPANIPAFTFALWVKPRIIDGTARRILDPNGGAGAGIQMFQSKTAGVVVRVMHSVANAEMDSLPGTLPVGVWSPVIMTWSDADNLPKLWIGQQQFSNSLGAVNKSGVRNTWSGSTAVIGNTIGSAAAFQGQLDKICIASRIWTATELSDYATRGAVPADARLLLYDCEEAAATGTLTDSSGNGITGTATAVTQGVTSYSIPARLAVA